MSGEETGPPGGEDRPEPSPGVPVAPLEVERAVPGPPSFWRAVGVSIEGLVRNWRVCLILTVPYALLASIPSQTLRSIGLGLDPTDASIQEVLVLGALFFAVAGTLVLVKILVYPPTLAALSLVGDAALLGERVELGPLVRTALDRAFSAVGTFLLVVLAVLAAPGAVGVLALVAGVAGGVEVALVVLGVGLVASIVPSLLFAVRFWLAVPAVVVEGLGPRDALKRSWNLVRGSFWWVGGVGFLLLLVGGILASIPQSIGMNSGATGVGFVLGAVLATLGAIIQTALMGVGTGVVYSARVLATSGASTASEQPPE